MSWHSFQTAIRVAPLYDNDFNVANVPQTRIFYINRGAIDYRLYYASSLKKWVMSTEFGMSFVVNGTTVLRPTYRNINGYSAYGFSGVGAGLYYDLSFGWVYGGNPGGNEEYWEPDNIFDDPAGPGMYRGTSFYTGVPPALGGTATFVGRGSNRGNVKDAYANSITITTKYERWESDDIYGPYTPMGGTSGTKYCGLPQWKDGDNNTYIRSLEKNSDKYTYGLIRYDTVNSKWIIGTYGSVSGWWEGEEPSKAGSVTFTFTVPEGSEVTGTDKTISFDKYVKGENTETIYLAETSRWF